MDRAACRLLQRELDVRAHPRGRLRVRLRSRTPCGAFDPQAFAPRAMPSIQGCRGMRRRARRATYARPKTDSPPIAPSRANLRVRVGRPGCIRGPAPLKRRARSLLGFLRACLLRREPSIPLSPTRCHGGLELLRRASRDPSRPVSRVERGRVWHHGPAKTFLPTPTREGRRFPEGQGAFHRESPRGWEGRPSSVRVGLSVTPPALSRVRALRSGD